MKCNERFIKVDPPNLQFISKLLASLHYLLSVNFCLESFFFDWKGIPARTLFIIYSNKIHDAEYLVLASAVTLPSAVVAILARLTIADHSFSNKR